MSLEIIASHMPSDVVTRDDSVNHSVLKEEREIAQTVLRELEVDRTDRQDSSKEVFDEAASLGSSVAATEDAKSTTRKVEHLQGLESTTGDIEVAGKHTASATSNDNDVLEKAEATDEKGAVAEEYEAGKESLDR